MPIFKRKILREMQLRSSVGDSLRSAISTLRTGFFEAPVNPALRDTKIDRDEARELYYNRKPGWQRGAFTARNIIDGTADYIGIPVVTVGDEAIDTNLNKWVGDYWAKALWEIYRQTLRDADCWVRIRKPLPSKLLAPGEDEVPQIEVIDSDRVTPYYHPTTNELIRVEVLTTVYIEDEPFDPAQIYAIGTHPHGREHNIIEIVTPTLYEYWDSTESTFLSDYSTVNEWGFVPFEQVFNDYDSALHGGSSDLEGVYPLFKMLHDVFTQTNTSHGYHADPKVQIQVKDVMNFISNNFPNSMKDGKYTGEISWRNRDVFFMESDSQTGNESISFVNANLNTGDSVNLMELIIDCMCMAAGVTESILFRAKQEGSTSSEEFERFKKKVERKRDNFEPYVKVLIRMGLYITGGNPIEPKLIWRPVDIDQEVQEATAFNDTVSALEVANRSQIISKRTYRAQIRRYVPSLKDDSTEESQIKTEVDQENKQQADAQKLLNSVTGNTSGNGQPGVNSAVRGARARAALPMEVPIPTPGQ